MPHTKFWIAFIAVFFGGLWLFNDILTPFVLGLLIAYLFNPVVEKIMQRCTSRVLAVCFVLILFFVLLAAFFAVVLPLLHYQIAEMVLALPGYIEKIKTIVLPYLADFYRDLPSDTADGLKSTLSGSVDEIFAWTLGVLKNIWSGGAALFDVLSLFIITPVVAFYLMRDWPELCCTIDDLLPRKQAKTIRNLLADMDQTIAAFLRGQTGVCMMLAGFYSVSLLVLGLNFGVLIGIASGLLSFIPFVGAIAGFAAGVLVAFLQTGDLVFVAQIAGVFIVGQFIEGNVLTPKLVGDKVGLHAVWVLFALLAGGSLFGFVGVLLAVPVAAIIGVLLRFLITNYKKSGYYKNQGAA